MFISDAYLTTGAWDFTESWAVCCRKLQDKHWKMVLLLMQCGADAKKKDSAA